MHVELSEVKKCQLHELYKINVDLSLGPQLRAQGEWSLATIISFALNATSSTHKTNTAFCFSFCMLQSVKGLFQIVLMIVLNYCKKEKTRNY